MLVAGVGAATGGTALPWLSTAGQIGSMVGNVGLGSFIAPAFSLLSAAGQANAGNQQAQIAAAQQRQYELSARQEELKGREQADKIRRGLQATLASQKAIFAGRGISPLSGTPMSIGNDSRTQASIDIEDAMFNAGTAASALRGQGYQSRLEGNAARTTAYGNAAKTLYGASDSFRSLLR